ncbi:cation-dependent mannose-6-phosphate receptor-like [Asterias amurensis]|uniref:cation-dependent mannose-6-phosphate receptor-like n=1 Tax=Asterias amurensis TaxID=7602 RepID=UPI003AB25091
MELFWVILCCILSLVQASCTVDSKSEEKYKVLLDPLKGQTVTVKDQPKDWQYTIKFCEGVEGQKTQDVGVLQTSLNKSDETHVVGKISFVDIKKGNDWILLTYKNGDTYGGHCGGEARQAHIMLLCNTKTLVGNSAVIEENRDKQRDCSYIFEISTSAACTVSTVSPIEGLSVGSVLVIITLSVIVAYLLLGFLYQRFLLGAKGIEQFPNISFWRDFGNLVADGCNLVFRTSPPRESRSYKGLGDDQLGFDEDEERDDHMLPM